MILMSLPRLLKKSCLADCACCCSFPRLTSSLLALCSATPGPQSGRVTAGRVSLHTSWLPGYALCQMQMVSTVFRTFNWFGLHLCWVQRCAHGMLRHPARACHVPCCRQRARRTLTQPQAAAGRLACLRRGPAAQTCAPPQPRADPLQQPWCWKHCDMHITLQAPDMSC